MLKEQPMNLARVLSAFASHGITVEKVEGNMNRFVASRGDKRLTWYMNRDSDHVSYFTWNSPQTDMMTDCNCDSYFHTIKGAIQFLGGVKGERTASDKPLENVEEVTVRKNEEKGGIEIVFPGKPSEDTLNELKSRGWRWSKFAGLWWIKFSEAEWEWANGEFSLVTA
jgi:hypothetical protein